MTPTFYPAHTFGFQVIGDHKPVILNLCGCVEEIPKTAKAFRIRNLAKEE